VREILVLFVSAVQPTRDIRVAHLKQCREYCNNHHQSSGETDSTLTSLRCRIRHQRLAIQLAPDDGEAFQYLGTALMEYYKFMSETATPPAKFNDSIAQTNSIAILQAAVACLQTAATLTPFDARVYNNLGIALSERAEAEAAVTGQATAFCHDEIEDAFQQGHNLLTRQAAAGVNVGQDTDSLCLNYGLYLANLDRFQEAAKILMPTARKHESELYSKQSSPSVDHAFRLYQFCLQQRVNSSP
jgi:tetratricopeptide (TPR) repeat protein